MKGKEVLKPPLPKLPPAIHDEIRLTCCRDIAMIEHDKLFEALIRHFQRLELLDLILFGLSGQDFLPWYVESCQKAHLGVWGGEIVDDAETELLLYVGCLD